jgi:hypothetical protein
MTQDEKSAPSPYRAEWGGSAVQPSHFNKTLVPKEEAFHDRQNSKL